MKGSHIEQAGRRVALLVFLADVLGAHRFDFDGQKEMIGEIGDAIAGDRRRRRQSLGAVEADEDIIDPSLRTRRGEDLTHQFAVGRCHQIDERAADEFVGQGVEKRWGSTGGENHVLRVAKFEQHVGATKRQGDETIPLRLGWRRGAVARHLAAIGLGRFLCHVDRLPKGGRIRPSFF